MPTNETIDENWEPQTHQLVDGDWVMTYRTPDGRLVDADGESVPPDSEYLPEPYVRTVVVDGERFHERESADGDGTTTWYDDGGNDAGFVDVTGADPLVRPGELYVNDGDIYRLLPTATGEDLIVDLAGEPVEGLSPHELRDDLELPEFAGFVRFGDRRAVVGVDGDGARQLYTVRGELIDGPIPWSDVELIDPGPLTGDPIAIGDYAMNDGGTARVHLFPDGSQAIETPDGGYERVIVPTDLEYPRGHAFFEGNIETGIDGIAATPLEVFSFADGQTAYRVDGELMLIDLPLDTTHPGEAPVACGPFPGGDLSVFPDGRQLIHRADGTWAIGDLPEIPPFDELVVLYGEPAPIEPGAVLDELSPPLDGPLDLADDITGLVHDPVAVEPEPVDDGEASADEPVPGPLADAPVSGLMPQPILATLDDSGLEPVDDLDVGLSVGPPPIPDVDLDAEPADDVDEIADGFV